MGKESAVNTMRAALALGADRGILVKTDAQFVDSSLTAEALKKAIEQLVKILKEEDKVI